jgi:GDP-4-dehydro-6-deoxy-D-mannose reductase
MKVLVTGASGFSGAHLLRLLNSKGIQVFTHGPEKGILGQHFHTPLQDLSALVEIIQETEPDYVFHLAGIARASHFADFYSINTLYAANLLQALEIAGKGESPVLLVGTSAEYGWIEPHQVPITEKAIPRPYNHYGISKLAQTEMGQLLARGGRKVIMVRPFNIIGRGMGDHLSVKNFALQVAEIVMGKRPSVISAGNLSSSRDFIDVEEAVEMYWDLIQNPEAYGEIVNICSGKATLMKDLLQKLISLSGQSIQIYENPGLFKDIDIPVHYGSPDRLRTLLGRVPSKKIDETLRDILEELILHFPSKDSKDLP